MAEESGIKKVIRGGQLTLHNIHMTGQVYAQIFLWSLLITLIFSVMVFLGKSNDYERYVVMRYVAAKAALTFSDKDKAIEFIDSNGRKFQTSAKLIIKSKFVLDIVNNLKRDIYISVLLSIVVYLALIIFATKWLRRKGEVQSQDKYISGDKLDTVYAVDKMIRKNNAASHYSLAGLHLIKDTETRHLLFSGTTGSGKSNAIKQLLEQIIASGDKAIVYDKGGDLIQFFFEEARDKILNPLDERSVSWNIWGEARDSTDYESMSEALIAKPSNFSGDPFWIDAARLLFKTVCYEMRNHPKKNMKGLIKDLLTTDLKSMRKFLQGTEAQSFTEEDVKKTSDCIKMVLATNTRALRYLKEDGDIFSIRKWIQDNNDPGCVFVSSLADRDKILIPLISLWMDIAANSLMAQGPNLNRRVWLILDELPSLNKLPYLTNVAEESRKFGGCLVIGIGSYSRLCDVYGRDAANGISSMLNSRFFFSVPDPDCARWVSQNLGETEFEEVRESTSYGANPIRDGISVHRQRVRKQLVNASEIFRLDKLEAYARLPGPWPITKLKFEYKVREKKNEPFIGRDIDEASLKEVEALIAKYENNQAIMQNKNPLPNKTENIAAEKPILITNEEIELY